MAEVPQFSSAIFFDVDGVLIDSMQAKGECFAELFDVHQRDEVLAIHFAHAGLNRYEKISLMIEHLRGSRPETSEVQELADSYANRVVQRVLNAPEIDGASNALRELRKKHRLHAISAMPTRELKSILIGHNMMNSFASIHGFPASKLQTMAELGQKYAYDLTACLAVGDSLLDAAAAHTLNIPFILVSSKDGVEPPGCVAQVENLVRLESVVQAVKSTE
jgi:phosphoglycolate phosphatase-like HAD superfamily hydrolase